MSALQGQLDAEVLKVLAFFRRQSADLLQARARARGAAAGAGRAERQGWGRGSKHVDFVP